jgi:hypothetical protein
MRPLFKAITIIGILLIAIIFLGVITQPNGGEITKNNVIK